MNKYKQNELTFHLMVEAVPNALLLVNSEGKIAYINKFAEDLFGYIKNEIIGKNLEILIPMNSKYAHPGMMNAYFKNPVRRQMGENRELYALKKDMTEFPVEIGLNPIVTIDGTMVLAAIIDITERVKTEKQFRVVVESAPNAMVLVDSSAVIQLINRQVEKQFGYTSSELVGQKLEILIPDRFKHAHKDYRTKYIEAPQTRSMGSGRDLFAKRKDGTEFPAEIGLNPIETKEGKLILASIIDITERKKYENEIIQSKNKLEELSEQLFRNNLDLEKKNNDINASIKYAKKIQYSILPSINEIKEHIPDYFLYYNPKNIIGGDFYWLFTQDDLIYVAVIDCTGHGVPGALMSMTVHSLLNEIMFEEKTENTGEILGLLHNKLNKELHQQKGDEYSQDGCDISLCKIDYKNKRLEYAGAHQNAYIYTGKSLETVKATKKYIGGLSIFGIPEKNRIFKSIVIPLECDITFVMTTDGVLDQLNKNDEVFGTQRFKELILHSQNISSEEMNLHIEHQINEWKFSTNQLDDMLLLGFKIRI